MRTDWNPLLRDEFDKEYWLELQDFVATQRSKTSIYPTAADVFQALHLTPYSEVRVLILGQDPYHGLGQANGLSFSVNEGIKIPPSLSNIYKEMKTDLGLSPPNHGNLETWAKQGVLLLNTVLTVEDSKPGSHRNHGWEIFSDRIIDVVSKKTNSVVFVLWGAAAQKKKALIDLDRHVVIESAHPSPLSAYRGFLGSRPFSKINQALSRFGVESIDWSIPHL
ncbi:MAG: uracil-DNA glycosylase [Candidatus Poriferisodalaceae bacterium]|jgi:uracil-DNA glycosylase|tara:strand:+ start:7425 stop:8090 length:666 start_codon:yes stop_codon:yes gene_type:complete